MQNFADNYFKRYSRYPYIIEHNPDPNLRLVVVIPCFSEPDILLSLRSLSNCYNISKQHVEVITVVNFGEQCSEDIKKYNIQTYKRIIAETANLNRNNITFHVILAADLPQKDAGVGLARKIGMDEAVRRFGLINCPEGIIASFDADSLVDQNYISEILSSFRKNPKAPACSIYFEHPITGTDFSQTDYERIAAYELHLRYYVLMLKYIGFPYSFHTIGSSFAVRASAYAKQGGMNKKKAGEDFYFLQKIIPLGHFFNLTSTRVVPSPRMSDRVPFGTGAAIKKMIDVKTTDFITYNFDSFLELKQLFDRIEEIFLTKKYDNVPPCLQKFLETNNFEKELNVIFRHSPNSVIFKKRFFDWFDAFRVMKFLNYAAESDYTKISIRFESAKLLKILGQNVSSGISVFELLNLLREIEKNNNFNFFET